MRLIFIRHADSLHRNTKWVNSQSACSGLSETGFQQSQRLADRFRETGEASGCCAFLSSPVLRARQTADVLASALPGCERVEDEALSVMNTGEASGLLWDEYVHRYGAFDLNEFPDRPFAPGGESWNQFVARIRSHLEYLAGEYAGRQVIAVTHAEIIVVSTLLLFNIQDSRQGWLDPLNTGLTEWNVEAGRWTLLRYNDTAHLQKKMI
jgi:broad specificity phosphatase PhoE